MLSAKARSKAKLPICAMWGIPNVFFQKAGVEATRTTQKQSPAPHWLTGHCLTDIRLRGPPLIGTLWRGHCGMDLKRTGYDADISAPGRNHTWKEKRRRPGLAAAMPSETLATTRCAGGSAGEPRAPRPASRQLHVPAQIRGAR